VRIDSGAPRAARFPFVPGWTKVNPRSVLAAISAGLTLALLILAVEELVGLVSAWLGLGIVGCDFTVYLASARRFLDLGSPYWPAEFVPGFSLDETNFQCCGGLCRSARWRGGCGAVGRLSGSGRFSDSSRSGPVPRARWPPGIQTCGLPRQWPWASDLVGLLSWCCSSRRLPRWQSLEREGVPGGSRSELWRWFRFHSGPSGPNISQSFATWARPSPTVC